MTVWLGDETGCRYRKTFREYAERIEADYRLDIDPILPKYVKGKTVCTLNG